MTDREIKLELTKIAMPCGMPIETAKKFFEWIMEEPEREVVSKPTQWDNTPIEQLAYKTRIEGTIIKRCKDNGINTVGDLIFCGAHKFSTFKLVGKKTITRIDDALEEHFGYSNWYTT